MDSIKKPILDRLDNMDVNIHQKIPQVDVNRLSRLLLRTKSLLLLSWDL